MVRTRGVKRVASFAVTKLATIASSEGMAAISCTVVMGTSGNAWAMLASTGTGMRMLMIVAVAA